MTRPSELRESDEDELLNRLAEAREELFNLRFQHVTGQLDNYARLGQVRKEVARLNTVLREKEIEAAEAVEREGGTPAAKPMVTPEGDAGRERRRARVLASRRAGARSKPEGESDEAEPAAAESEDGEE